MIGGSGFIMQMGMGIGSSVMMGGMQGMGGMMGMGQNPMMQMMQMMMGLMQGIGGGQCEQMPGMTSGMPGMMSGMPGMMGGPGFSPMMSNNLGGFLGNPGMMSGMMGGMPGIMGGFSGDPMGMQQNPMMQMMQMMMQMMQMMQMMMSGGNNPSMMGMMGGMPGMMGGMPGMGGGGFGMPGMGGGGFGMPGMGGGTGAYAGIGPNGPYAGAFGGPNGAQMHSQIGDGNQPAAIRQGKRIGSNIAGAFDAMVAAAKADGVDLKINSGFRSHAEQQALWNKNPNPKMVARPGTSNHEKGNAIDFANTPKAWDWLKKNAGRFGFKNYAPEPWHYSLTGN